MAGNRAFELFQISLTKIVDPVFNTPFCLEVRKITLTTEASSCPTWIYIKRQAHMYMCGCVWPRPIFATDFRHFHVCLYLRGWSWRLISGIFTVLRGWFSGAQGPYVHECVCMSVADFCVGVRVGVGVGVGGCLYPISSFRAAAYR